MLILEIKLKGGQTEKHCSATSSIDACEKLLTSSGRCRMYRKGLVYDWDAHAFVRCEECVGGEIKGDATNGM